MFRHQERNFNTVPQNSFKTPSESEFAIKADGSSFSTGSEQLATVSRVEYEGAAGLAQSDQSACTLVVINLL